MKIVFFGDSLTWGGYGGDYVGEVRRLVGKRHEIVNAGVGGNTVVNLSRRLEDDVLAHEPDAVFMMVGGNDAISYSQPDSRPYYRKAMSIPDGTVTPEMFRREFRHILGELQVNHIHTYVALPPIEQNPTVVTAMREFNAIAREVAQSHNVPVLDLFEHFVPDDIPERAPLSIRTIQLIGERERTGWDSWEEAQREGDYSYTFDGVHWTPTCAEKVAEQIVAFMDLLAD